jgi:hypothetical protein
MSSLIQRSAPFWLKQKIYNFLDLVRSTSCSALFLFFFFCLIAFGMFYSEIARDGAKSQHHRGYLIEGVGWDENEDGVLSHMHV